MRNYIPVKKHWFEMYTKFDKPYFTPQIKFPIEKIMIDKSYYANKQNIFKADVFYMLVNFDREAWAPVLINIDYLLLDGYHRVEVAKQMGLSFVDVVIEDSELFKNSSKKESDGKKRSHSKTKEA